MPLRQPSRQAGYNPALATADTASCVLGCRQFWPMSAPIHERMEGRDDNGDFKTARAKVYPVGLNRVIAGAVHKFIFATFAGANTEATLHPDFSTFQAMDFAADEAIQPDYQG